MDSSEMKKSSQSAEGDLRYKTNELTDLGFNSTIVRLKRDQNNESNSGRLRFNSTIVRLKLDSALIISHIFVLFQFYNSSIKTHPNNIKKISYYAS